MGSFVQSRAIGCILSLPKPIRLIAIILIWSPNHKSCKQLGISGDEPCHVVTYFLIETGFISFQPPPQSHINSKACGSSLHPNPVCLWSLHGSTHSQLPFREMFTDLPLILSPCNRFLFAPYFYRPFYAIFPFRKELRVIVGRARCPLRLQRKSQPFATWQDFICLQLNMKGSQFASGGISVLTLPSEVRSIRWRLVAGSSHRRDGMEYDELTNCTSIGMALQNSSEDASLEIPSCH